MNRRLIITLLFFVSMAVLSGNEYRSVAAQEQAVPSPAPVLPDTEKIRGISFGYTREGVFGKAWFFGEDGKSHHWLEVWRLQRNSTQAVVNYVVQPNLVVTWGHGPVLADAFASQCLAEPSSFEKDDYWVAKIDGDHLAFVLLNQEERKNLEGLFQNLQIAETHNIAGGVLQTTRRLNTWETNIMSLFQKGKRQWLKPEWVQRLTICINR